MGESYEDFEANVNCSWKTLTDLGLHFIRNSLALTCLVCYFSRICIYIFIFGNMNVALTTMKVNKIVNIYMSGDFQRNFPLLSEIGK